MKKLLLGTVFALAAGLSLSGTAHATPTLQYQIYENAVLVDSGSSGTGTLNVNFTDSLFNVTITTHGVGFLPSPDLSTNTESVTSNSAVGGTIKILVTQVGLTIPSGPFTFSNTLGLNNLIGPGVTSTNSTYADTANGAYAQTLLLGSLTGVSGASVSNGTGTTTPFPGSALFSETDVLDATFSAANQDLSSNNQLVNIPEPISLSLFGASLVGLGLARRRKNRAA
jgi:hypothetical protein